MDLNKIFLKNLSFTSVSFFLLGLALVAAVFFIGGISLMSLALVAPMVLLIVYLRHNSEAGMMKLPKVVLFFVSIFILFSAVSIFKSYDIHQSVIVFLWLIISVIVGLEAGAMAKEEKGLAKFSNIVIISSIIAVASGLYLYFTFDDYSNLRFISTFFQPNPFAGFLLLPLSLLLPLFVYTENKKKKILLGVLSVLTLSAFILTVSRGAMVIFAFVWVFILIFSLVKNEFKLRIPQMLNITLIIALSLVLSVAVYKVKMSYAPAPFANNTTATTTSNNTGIFSGGATKGEAVSSRLQYMKTGLLVTKDNMLNGVGIGAYREAEIKYRDNVIYQTNDPHNLYLRMFSETGVVGGISFFVLVAMLGVFILFKLWKTKFSDFSAVELGLVVGTLAIILHNFMDSDWYFPANMFLSIITFFVLYSVLSKNDSNFSAKKIAITRIVFMIIGFIVVLVSILIFLGNNSGMDGPYLVRKNKNDEAVTAFRKGLSFDKYNPEVLQGYSALLLSQSKSITDANLKKESLNDALSFASKALLIKPHDADLFGLRADIYNDLGNKDLYEADLKKAIENNKTLGLSSYMSLSQKYSDEKKYLDVISVVDDVMKYYPVGVFQDSFWASPDKGMLKFEIFLLSSQKINALEKLGRKDEAKAVQDLIKLY
ncbi:MAG: O-antigen ligase family protein [Candidatus Nomurabacteria bacterium]|nr:O-antigen ligase family protein [Candidatus Nomurabacteria bacterium]